MHTLILLHLNLKSLELLTLSLQLGIDQLKKGKTLDS
jgi:hypothetical protein